MLLNFIQARDFLRLNENSGGPPRTRVYSDTGDAGGIPTISTGFNLNRPDARSWIEAVGANFDRIYSGAAELTAVQAETIETRVINEADAILRKKLSDGVFNKLTANQQAALVSLCVNGPDLIGPNLTKYIKASQFKAAEDEIRHRSNASRHPGLQNRRNREADLFAKR